MRLPLPLKYSFLSLQEKRRLHNLRNAAVRVHATKTSFNAWRKASVAVAAAVTAMAVACHWRCPRQRRCTRRHLCSRQACRRCSTLRAPRQQRAQATRAAALRAVCLRTSHLRWSNSCGSALQLVRLLLHGMLPTMAAQSGRGAHQARPGLMHCGSGLRGAAAAASHALGQARPARCRLRSAAATLS